MPCDTYGLAQYVCKETEQAHLSLLRESKPPRIHDPQWGNTQTVTLSNDVNLSMTKCN